MLYDARGKPLGLERETNEATLAGVSFAYSVLRAGAVDAEAHPGGAEGGAGPIVGIPTDFRWL